MQKMPPAIFTGTVFGLLQSFGLGFLTVFLIARFRRQNYRISTSGCPNLTIPKTSPYSNPVDEYSCVRM